MKGCCHPCHSGHNGIGSSSFDSVDDGGDRSEGSLADKSGSDGAWSTLDGVEVAE